jgi:glycosyltransferase involved in cell wall biosynthesis
MIAASVIIPTYNAQAFIEETLKSVFEQTVLPAEILVVDDCSPDNTREVLAKIAKEAPVPVRVVALPKNSGGPSRPYNVGIEEAKHDLILLLDQDDLMFPKRVELQTATLAECPQCTLAIGRFSIIGCSPDDLSLLWTVSQFEEFSEHIDEQAAFSVLDSTIAFPPLLKRNYSGSCSNFAFSRTRWREFGGFFDEKAAICNDLDAILRAAAAGPIAIINDRLFEYRWSPQSLFRRDLTRSLLDATMVRLRAASANPDLAGEELHALRYSALTLASAVLRKGDFGGMKTIAETMILHRGTSVVTKSIDKRIRKRQG